MTGAYNRWTPLVASALAAAVTLAPARADAQPQGEAQRALYDRALAAMDKEDYPAAISLLRRARTMGELNIILASLGRAYQRSGRCEEAARAFDDALRAPTVDIPPPEEVARLVERFEGELRRDCPGYLEITCTPPNLTIQIGARGPFACGERIPLPPGRHEVLATGEAGLSRLSAEVEGLTTTRVAVAIADAGPAPDARPWLEGLLYLTGGVAASSSGVVLDTVPDSTRNYEFDALDLAPVGLYAIGLSAVAYGLYTLLK